MQVKKEDIQIRRVNLRGSQARACAADPQGETAQEFKAFAAREATREGYRVELYIAVDASGGIGKGSPWFWANPDGSRSDDGGV